MAQALVGDYAEEQARILRRQALAEALRKQAMSPIQTSQGGKYVSGINPLQAIAKIGEAYMANRESGRAESDTKALGERIKVAGDKAISDFETEMAGDPGSPDPMTGQPGPSRKGNPLKAAAILANSPNPMHQQMAARLMEQATKPQKFDWRDSGGDLVQIDEQGNPTGKKMAKTAAPQAPDRSLVMVQDPNSPTGYSYISRSAADGKPAPGKGAGGPGGKALPVAAAKSLFENQQNLRRAQQAMALMQGKNVTDQQGNIVSRADPDATGVKGYLPDIMLQRMDAGGNDTRAAIADLGSLVIHDRSGAAVTAAEYPRLAPFIPKATDDPSVVKTKLARFVQEYQNVVKEMGDFYTQSGYHVPTDALINATTTAPADISGGGKPVASYFKR